MSGSNNQSIAPLQQDDQDQRENQGLPVGGTPLSTQDDRSPRGTPRASRKNSPERSSSGGREISGL